MSRRLIFIVFVLVVLGAGSFVYFVVQDPSSHQAIPIIGDDDEPEPAEPETFDKTQFSLADPASPWVIANKQRPLDPLTYAPPDLVIVGGGQQMRDEAAEALAKMFAAAKKEGLTLQPLSGYRSYTRQKVVYQNNIDTYGQAEADRASAKPGYSEHQTGWSIDIGGGGCGIEDCFGDTKHGKWVAANAYKYGFVVRYPDGKEDVTGYRYEPWHVRYIGADLATEMRDQKITTLEEFFDL